MTTVDDMRAVISESGIFNKKYRAFRIWQTAIARCAWEPNRGYSLGHKMDEDIEYIKKIKND